MLLSNGQNFSCSLGENSAVTLFGVPDFARALLPILKLKSVLRHILLLVLTDDVGSAPGVVMHFNEEQFYSDIRPRPTSD